MIARSRVTITLPAILREQAQIVAAERGDSVSDVVRLALQQYLEKTRKEREGLTALYAEFADEDRQLAEAGLQAYAASWQRRRPAMRRGDVYLADLNPVKGSEQAGRRSSAHFSG